MKFAASQNIFFFIFVGVVCLGRGIVMFFVGLLLLRFLLV